MVTKGDNRRGPIRLTVFGNHILAGPIYLYAWCYSMSVYCGHIQAVSLAAYYNIVDIANAQHYFFLREARLQR